jgi:uncharacterized spore protein YtfJ
MLERLVSRVGDIQEKATVKTVFGDPLEVRGRTIIPIARVRYGFGIGMGRGASRKTGDGDDSGGGSGGGGGASVRPVAVIEITDDRTTVTPVVDVTRLAMAGLILAAWSVFWIGLMLRAARADRL